MVNITNTLGLSPGPASSLRPDTYLGFQGVTTQFTYISPAGTSNDVNGGFPRFLGNTRLAVTLPAGAGTWTGLEAGIDGQHLVLWNRDAANSLTLMVSNVGSVYYNRFNGPAANYILSAGNACELVYYEGEINAWVITAGASTGGGGGGGGNVGTLIPVTITAASSDDYNPGSGWPISIGRLDINPTTNNIILTGLVAGLDGQQVVIRNVGTSGYLVTLSVANTSSSGANRFTGEGDAGLPQGAQLYAIYYDTPTAGWAIG